MNIDELRNIIISMLDMEENPSDEDIHNVIDEVMNRQEGTRKLTINGRYNLHKTIYDSIRGLGALEDLIEDKTVTEVMVNGTNNIFIERDGVITQIDKKYSSGERLEDVIQQIVAQTNKRVNEANPIVDTRLKDGSRVNVVLPPISLGGAVVTIRKFPNEPITMDKLIGFGSITEEAAEFLKMLVRAGYNIFVSGGTGSGKTTFLNALSNYIEKDERIITIEDSAELRLEGVANLVTLETRSATSEGTVEISIRDLIKTSLRMRPDRIIVGEVRGGEALDMLQAMNTGHDGSMSTGHGNSPKDMLARLETMVLMGIEIPLKAIRSQIASGIDILVHLGRMHDKSRKVLEIDEITGIKNGEIQLSCIFELKKKEGEYQLCRTGRELQNKEKLLLKGYIQ